MSEIVVQKTGEDLASRSLQVTVPVERVNAAERKAVRQYAQRARLPGFRKGHAPEAVIRKRFGGEIRQLVLEEVIREGWEQAKTTEALQPVADPSVRNVKFEVGQPVEFELLVEVRPVLTLDRTGGFTVSRQVAPVVNDQVEEHLDRLREQKATWIPVEGEPPSPGQLVQVEVAPIEDGVVHEAKPYSIVLGSGQTLPDLEARVMEMAVGETTEADVRFPEDHSEVEKRGQSRRVRITLHAVKRQELPTLDDGFAKEVGDFETLDILRAAIREDLEGEAVKQADADIRAALIGHLVEANGVVAPPSMVDRMLQALARAYEVPEEQWDGFATQMRRAAEQRVCRDLILDAVMEAEGLKATEADVDAKVQEIADRRGVPAGKVYSSLQQAKRLAELEHGLTEEKVFQFLLSQSTVHEVTP